MASLRSSLVKTTSSLTQPRLVLCTNLSTSRNHFIWANKKRAYASVSQQSDRTSKDTQAPNTAASSASDISSNSTTLNPPQDPKSPTSSAPADWEDETNYNIENFTDLPHANFGANQHMQINADFKEAMRQMLWQFRAPIRYAFAYGSGVFPQTKDVGTPSSSRTSIHPKAPLAVQNAQGSNPKMIDFIFGVSFTQHWHSLNLAEHRDHYSALGSLGSGAVSYVQDKWGAGVYFNPYVTVNGTLIKYGVVNLDTLCEDLSTWNTLYLAGRLQKPVKILRDNARVRLANQANLMAALRTALLLLPETFTEHELYGVIANISYLGDPRMALPTEDPSKVANIVGNNIPYFRQLYSPLVDNLPNVRFADAKTADRDWAWDPTSNVRLQQDMDPIKRGNMVRRLPKAFRGKLYFQYQSKFQIPRLEFDQMMENSKDEDATRINRREGGGFEQRIASQPIEDIRTEVRGVIKNTISWPSTSQSLKGPFTAGYSKTVRYMGEKIQKYREGKAKASAEAAASAEKDKTA